MTAVLFAQVKAWSIAALSWCALVALFGGLAAGAFVSAAEVYRATHGGVEGTFTPAFESCTSGRGGISCRWSGGFTSDDGAVTLVDAMLNDDLGVEKTPSTASRAYAKPVRVVYDGEAGYSGHVYLPNDRLWIWEPLIGVVSLVLGWFSVRRVERWRRRSIMAARHRPARSAEEERRRHERLSTVGAYAAWLVLAVTAVGVVIQLGSPMVGAFRATHGGVEGTFMPVLERCSTNVVGLTTCEWLGTFLSDDGSTIADPVLIHEGLGAQEGDPVPPDVDHVLYVEGLGGPVGATDVHGTVFGPRSTGWFVLALAVVAVLALIAFLAARLHRWRRRPFAPHPAAESSAGVLGDPGVHGDGSGSARVDRAGRPELGDVQDVDRGRASLVGKSD